MYQTPDGRGKAEQISDSWACWQAGYEGLRVSLRREGSGIVMGPVSDPRSQAWV